MYFYRILFSSLCFITFGAALAFKGAGLYIMAMIFGALALSARRKMWDDPVWAELYLEKFDKFWGRLIKRFHPDAEEQIMRDGEISENEEKTKS